jgi:hypothetical protein
MNLSRLCPLAILCIATSAQAQSDTFNRTVLGPDWTVRAGTINLDGDTVGGDNSSLMTYGPGTGYSSASVDMQVPTGFSVSSGAIVLGYGPQGQCAYIKIQDNNDLNGGYDRAYFYYGNQGDGFLGTHILIPFTTSPHVRVTASLNGSVATLSIDSNFDGVADGTYSYDYGSTTVFGDGVGLGFYGSMRMDNFTVNPVPEPSVAAMLGLGGLGLLCACRRKQ